ncbi:MAG TPA: prolyl oligopeptidase family serine peptidase [Dongiaceae bacterium]|nr:prolyl oligopeptidase family serine peptidase [Dongiaceae bacterium]
MPDYHPDDVFLDRLLDVPSLIAPSISPPGFVAAWSWGGRGEASETFLRATGSEDEPLRLHGEGEDVVLQSWRADGNEFILAVTRDGSERVRLLRSPVVNVKPAPLTEPQPNYYISGGELDPKGRWLFFAANVDPETGKETEASWIIRQDLATGERIVLAKPKRANRTRPMVNLPGTHVLYSRKDRHPAGRQYWLVDVDGKNDREILNFGEDVEITARWTPSGQQVIVIADSGAHRRVGLWLMDSGLIHWFFDDPHMQIDDAFVPGNSGSMIVIESRQGRKYAWLFDVATRRKTPWPEIAGATLLPLAPLTADSWAARFYHARQPADLMRVTFAGGKVTSATSMTGLPKVIGSLPEELIAPEEIRWPSSGGLTIQGWIYRTKAPAKGTIVDIHGGPTWHVENRFDAQTQYLLRRGFNVFLPNYRGSTGFGLSFQEAIRKQGWGGAEQEDIRSGITTLIDKGIASKGKIGVTGVSYGGYSSWWAITHFPLELVAAAAPICGMTDLVVDYETTRPDLRLYSEQMMGGSPSQVSQRYRDRSPIHHVAAIKGRLLIVQGMRDPNVTPENLAAMRRALDTAKIAYELLTFEDEGHGIRKRANNRVLYRRLADFFEAAFA